jgi:hypothetical protein
MLSGGSSDRRVDSQSNPPAVTQARVEAVPNSSGRPTLRGVPKQWSAAGPHLSPGSPLPFPSGTGIEPRSDLPAAPGGSGGRDVDTGHLLATSRTRPLEGFLLSGNWISIKVERIRDSMRQSRMSMRRKASANWAKGSVPFLRSECSSAVRTKGGVRSLQAQFRSGASRVRTRRVESGRWWPPGSEVRAPTGGVANGCRVSVHNPYR